MVLVLSVPVKALRIPTGSNTGSRDTSKAGAAWSPIESEGAIGDRTEDNLLQAKLRMLFV